MTGSNYCCATCYLQVHNDQMLLCKIFAHLVRRDGTRDVFETRKCVLTETMYTRLNNCKFDNSEPMNSKCNLIMMINNVVDKSFLLKLDNGCILLEILEVVKLSDGFCQKRFKSFCQKKAGVCQSVGSGHAPSSLGRVGDGLTFSCSEEIG